MEHSEYSTLYELEDTYWWYVGRRSIFETFLEKYAPPPGLTVDIGCGTGANLAVLKRFSKLTLGFDVSQSAVDYCRRRGFLNVKVILPDAPLPLDPEQTQLITLFDVLEHAADDEAMLSQVYKGLQPGGVLMISVPAYQFLWSEHDEALHHFRRYNRSELTRKLEDTGFHIVRASYAIVFSCPIIIVYRGLKGLLNKVIRSRRRTSHVRLPVPLNAFFILLLKCEAVLLRYLNFPFGTSIVVVAKK